MPKSAWVRVKREYTRWGQKRRRFWKNARTGARQAGGKTASPANSSDWLRRYPLAQMREKDPKNKKSSKP